MYSVNYRKHVNWEYISANLYFVSDSIKSYFECTCKTRAVPVALARAYG